MRAGGLLLLVVVVSPVLADPVLSELSPRPVAGEGEWFEIENPDSVAVPLEGWLVWDGTGRRRTLPAHHLAPGARVAVAARPESLVLHFALPDSVAVVRPSGWPALNDRDAAAGEPADHLVLARPDGTVVDSVAYFEAWLPEERGRSLERVSPGATSTAPASWGWSLDPRGGTPGTRNTLAGDGRGDRGALTGPERVQPRSRPAVYGWRVPGPGILGVWLVDEGGRDLAVLREPAPAPAAGEFVWGAALPVPARPGRCFLCLRWRGEAGVVRRCRSVWVTP